jgi:ureidoacrylate peracid hydrolase
VGPEQVALVLVDIQRDFWRPLKDHPEFSSFPGNVEILLSEARSQGLTVVHVRSEFDPDRSNWMLFYRPEGRGEIPCIAGTEGTRFEDYAAPMPGEKIVEKEVFDGFVGTDLEAYLKKRGVKAALISGLETSVCVLFTATSAYLRRIVPLVVTDACADEPSRHEAALRMYGDLSFKAVTTSQVTGEWAHVMALIEQFADD